MADHQPVEAKAREREYFQRWLRDWTATTALLEAERDERLAALTDEGAWCECQDLLAAWQPEMEGDAGQGLEIQQSVFRRWWTTRRD